MLHVMIPSVMLPFWLTISWLYPALCFEFCQTGCVCEALQQSLERSEQIKKLLDIIGERNTPENLAEKTHALLAQARFKKTLN